MNKFIIDNTPPMHPENGQAFVWDGEIYIVADYDDDANCFNTFSLSNGMRCKFSRHGDRLNWVDLEITARWRNMA